MATSFNDVKTNIPGVGDRAYIFAQYSIGTNANCTPNQANTSRQCEYMAEKNWDPGEIMDGIYPNIGDWVSSMITSNPGTPQQTTWTACYRLLEIIDEATFLTGTCTSCYNNGYGGNCSDAFITVPPYPGDPLGCRYDNSINIQGIVVVYSYIVSSGQLNSTWIANDCSECIDHTPPVFEPNMVVNCCDPTETYNITPGPPYFSTVLNDITGTSVGQLGVTNFTQAFIADLYIGGAQTSDKCWHLKEDYPPFGPMAFTATFASVAISDCTALNLLINNICCGTPPPPPPLYEWCCMTGVAGPAGQSTCTQVPVGTCQPSMANYSSGPFATQLDCQNNPCGTPPPPNTWYCPEEINMATNTSAGCCIIVPPSGVPNSNYQTFTTQQDCQNQTQCCNETSQGMDSCCGGVEQGDPCTYNSWNNYFTAQNRIDYCNNHCLPGQPYWNGGAFSLPYCPCCPHDLGCEPPFAKLAKLTSKLDKFTKWKNKSLGK